MKAIVAVAVLLFMFLSGCVLKAEKPVKEVKPVKPVVVISGEKDVYRPGYTILAYDRPGLVGRIAASQGHVLTTESDQDYTAISAQLEYEAKAKKRAKTLIKFQKMRDQEKVSSQSKIVKKETKSRIPLKSWNKEEARLRAWKRYCNSGLGMTDEDINILKRENFVIPAAFAKYCRPPK